MRRWLPRTRAQLCGVVAIVFAVVLIQQWWVVHGQSAARTQWMEEYVHSAAAHVDAIVLGHGNAGQAKQVSAYLSSLQWFADMPTSSPWIDFIASSEVSADGPQILTDEDGTWHVYRVLPAYLQQPGRTAYGFTLSSRAVLRYFEPAWTQHVPLLLLTLCAACAAWYWRQPVQAAGDQSVATESHEVHWATRVIDAVTQPVWIVDPSYAVRALNPLAQEGFAEAPKHVCDLTEQVPWGHVLLDLLDRVTETNQSSVFQSITLDAAHYAIAVVRLETPSHHYGYWISCDANT